MSNARVWSEKAPECLFIGEGWTTGSSIWTVPIPRSCSALLQAPGPCPHNLALPQQPELSITWSCSSQGAGCMFWASWSCWLPVAQHPRATAAPRHPFLSPWAKPWHGPQLQGDLWLHAVPSTTALCAPTYLGEVTGAPVPEQESSHGHLWVASWMESPKPTPRGCFSESSSPRLAALRCQNELSSSKNLTLSRSHPRDGECRSRCGGRTSLFPLPPPEPLQGHGPSAAVGMGTAVAPSLSQPAGWRGQAEVEEAPVAEWGQMGGTGGGGGQAGEGVGLARSGILLAAKVHAVG